MATPTYDLLASTTLATTASSVTFSSIDQSYGDLILVASLIPSHAAAYSVYCRFNSDTGSNYPFVRMQGDGSSAASPSGTEDHIDIGLLGLSGSSIATLQVLDYSATDKHKTSLVRTTHSQYSVRAGAARWSNTSAVSSILVYPSGGLFIANDSFNLYGVAK
jgi:hypothetical protein